MSKVRLSIATYSAHDSILRVLNKKAEIEKLFVNAGGLRVPPGINAEKPYLKKYQYVKGKTLHAKVNFFSDGADKNEVWLWTGNLRKSTFESQNVLMSFPVTKNGLAGIRDWFSPKCQCTQHIVLKSDGNKIINAFPSPGNMWVAFKESLECVMKQEEWMDENDVKVYIFSPWGAKNVVKKIRSFFKEAKFSLYTQNVGKEENSWVDCCEEDDRYIAGKDKKFPHFKCMFVFRGTDLVWSYVGSANFTKSAMLETKNVEHALFFEGGKHNKEQKNLFKVLKNMGWKLRTAPIKNGEAEETRVEELEYELKYDPQCFIELQIANKVLSDFSSRRSQKRLEESYLKEEGKGDLIEPKSKAYKIKVLALEMEQIYVKVFPKGKEKLEFELSIPRKSGQLPKVTSADISAKFDELERIASGDGNGVGGGGGGAKKEKEKITFLNVRFPMEFYSGKEKKDARKKAFKIINDLKEQDLDETQKLKLDIWFPLLEKLGV